MQLRLNSTLRPESDSEIASHNVALALPLPWRTGLILAIILSLGLALLAAKHRTPWSDEGWFSSASWNLAKHGFMGTTVMESAGTPFTRIDRRTYWVMPLYLVAQAGWYIVAPPTLWSTRALNVIWALLALCAYYLFLCRVFGHRRPAALAAILLALSFIFIDNTGFARPDIMCCSLGLAGLAAYIFVRESSLSRALVLGNTFTAAALFTHPNGIFHCVALIAVVLWLDRRRLRMLSVFVSALPYIVIGACWSVYIAQDPQAFLDQMRANGGSSRWPGTANPITIIWNEIYGRYLVAFGFATRGLALLKAYALFAYIAGCVGVVATKSLRRNPAVRLLLLLTSLYFVGLCVFNQKLSYYLIHIVPFYIALLAAWLYHLSTTGGRLIGYATVLFVTGLVLVETAGIALKATQRSYIASEHNMVSFVKQHTAGPMPIVGSAALIYGFDFDSRLIDDGYLGLRSGRVPQAIVIDGPLYQTTYNSWLTKRPADMKQILERLGRYRQTYNDGTFRVYLPVDASYAGMN